MRVLLSCFPDSYTAANDAVGVLRQLNRLPPSVRALLEFSGQLLLKRLDDQPSALIYEEHFTLTDRVSRVF
jgi:hypothetical protein